MPHRAFFLASLFWNLGHGMSWMALPLYAASQGLSNAEIGTLISLPVLAQAPLNLLGGAYTDRIGARRIMLASTAAMTGAAAWLIVAQGFAMLVLGQLALAFSRAIFWPAVWAMASELPGDRGRQLGRLNAVTNFGQIAGNVLCGVSLAAAGFGPTFGALAAMAVLAFVTSLLSPRGGQPRGADARPLFARYLPILRKRIVSYSILCAYLSAVPFSLALSFFPLLLSRYGYADEVSGVLLALRSVGAIGAALIASRFVRGGAGTPWPVWCGLLIAAAVGALPAVNHPALIAFWLLLVGVGSGAMTLFFQMTISEASQPAERASALALGGTGWNLSLLATPFAMGLLADRYGLAAAFYAVAGLTVLVVALLAAFRRWGFPRPARAPQ